MNRLKQIYAEQALIFAILFGMSASKEKGTQLIIDIVLFFLWATMYFRRKFFEK